ncbi:MAG: hypothetical protein GXP08_02270 [Gammaproteobacteria bacterium]|nr:hypothetical protein [Gammaproteobacteria bacterium]
MSFTDVFLIVPNYFVSGAIWFVILAVFFYMARDSAHGAIKSFSRMLHNAMRLSSFALERVEHRLSLRNKEVLLAAGREASERVIEREFERINATVSKELAETPSLHRKLQEEIAIVEDAYKESTEVPPSPPGWVAAVEAVAKIPSKGDPVVVDILEDIHESLVNAHKSAIEEYRTARKEKHEVLKGMLPSWRKVLHVIDVADSNVISLLERSKVIDRHMEDYENILNGSDRAVRMLSSSSLSQFFISLLVLSVAVGGAMINFHLIARPMAEMVGGNSMIGGYRTADIAALVIILVEITMGIFLMESLRITRLFPAIGALKDKMRVRMIWITFSFLFSLAAVEAGLAYMRELLMHDELATSALLRGEVIAAANNEFAWITTAAQMGMGFILPFALTFVAIPLENFIASTRTLLGVSGIGVVRVLAFFLRVLGNSFHYMGIMMLHIYDLFVFAPLWFEYKIKNRKKNEIPTLIAKETRKLESPDLIKEAS